MAKELDFGHNGPKGSFKLRLGKEEKSLFEIIIDKLHEINKLYNIVVPYYIMTSNENNRETIEFFKEMNYFNYPKESIKFFVQDEIAMTNKEGKLLIDEDGIIKMASNGNGAIFKAMKKNKIIEDLILNNVDWIEVIGIDNILNKPIDPILLGLTIQENNLIGTKSVEKESPNEGGGVFVRKDNKPGIIEYTEVSNEIVEQRDDEGNLVYSDINIVNHVFNIEAIKKLANLELGYHVATKKANYINQNGELIIASEPNCYKFEEFIFDGFSYFDNISLLRGIREEEFAPIKNKTGNNSPETAIKLYNSYMKKIGGK